METARNSRIAALGVVGLIAAGCGSSSRATSPSGGADAGACPYPLPYPPASYASIASGTVAGGSVNGTLCEVPIALLVSSSPNVALPENALLLSFGLDSDQSVGVEIDAGQASGWVEGALQLRAPAPGVYTSHDGTCGFVMFGYEGSAAPDASCAGTPPACSPGCAPTEPLFDSGTYCGPVGPQDVYEATAASTCLDPEPLTPTGSWTLNIDTVESAEVDAGAQVAAYLAHGRLAALLPDPAGRVVSLALSF